GVLVLDNWTCPCCGYKDLLIPAYRDLTDNTLIRGYSLPYCVHFGDASYDVCSCCGYEFGFNDEPGIGEGQSFEDYLMKWKDDGCPWFDATKMPTNWTLDKQLKGNSVTSPKV
ncbi:MAG: hypothetical protein L0215_17710, partial [Gemmataceae bacterium]|nr:hypothetical protein [Gemmataceae bacterium]